MFATRLSEGVTRLPSAKLAITGSRRRAAQRVTNYTGGSGGSAPYSGATWVLISQSTESHNSTTSSLC